MRDGNVIHSGIGVSGQARFERKHAEPGQCRHRAGYLVDDASGIVSCRKCKDQVEPFVALSRIAKEASRWRQQEISLQAEVRRLRCVVDDLKREERNARAHLKRAEEAARDA